MLLRAVSSSTVRALSVVSGYVAFTIFLIEVARPWLAERRFHARLEANENPAASEGGSWSLFRATSEHVHPGNRLVTVHDTTWEQASVGVFLCSGSTARFLRV